MPLEILTGPEVPALLARAQRTLGEDAVVLSVRRVVEGRRMVFEMTAADPATAERHAAEERTRRAAVAARVRPATAPAAPSRSAAAPPERSPEFWDVSRPASPAAPPVPVTPGKAPAPAPRRFGWPFAPGTGSRRGGRTRVVALVGPTGAGKTTTIAKLANHPLAFAGRRVGWLCLDTYRIGGVEQARQYAELSKLPFEVAWDTPDVQRAMRRLRDCEVVLVDTPGRGPRSIADLRETQSRLLELAPDEVHLALPAGMQRSLARRIVTVHLPLGVTHLLPTKLDEYPDERGAFELARQFGLPMRWVADGQEVPRDLQRAPETPGVPGAALVAEAV